MSKSSFQTILWLAILVVGIGLIAFSLFTRDAKAPGLPSATPTDSFLLQPTSTPASLLVSPAMTKAATCQISGSIKFINDNLYETKGAKIAYQNVDDSIRQIYWKTKPDDRALAVGPNLFEQLPVPKGEREVGVTLYKNTGVKLYTLTAQVTYGVKRPQGGEIVKEANCTGTISVTLP